MGNNTGVSWRFCSKFKVDRRRSVGRLEIAGIHWLSWSGASEVSDPGSNSRLWAGLGGLCPVSGSSSPGAIRHQPPTRSPAFAPTATDQPTNANASPEEAEESPKNTADETGTGSGRGARPTVNPDKSAAGLNHPRDSGCQGTRLRNQPDDDRRRSWRDWAGG